MKDQKTVLLTGSTGFLGSVILGLLLEDGYRVVSIIRNGSDLFRIKSNLEYSNVVLFNIEDGLENCFRENKIDFIIHTATCYGRNDEKSADIIKANLSLQLELLEFGRRNNCRCFINADTFFNEQLGLKPKERIYVKTKKYFVQLAQEIVPDEGIKFVNLVIQQMYGPADSLKKFVPGIIVRLLNNENIYLTKGDQKRDFIFVKDVARSFVNVVDNFDNLNQYEEFGVGTGRSNSIKETVELLKVRINSKSFLDWDKLPYRENEIMDSVANLENNRKINWKAVTNLEDGLRETIEYFNNK